MLHFRLFFDGGTRTSISASAWVGEGGVGVPALLFGLGTLGREQVMSLAQSGRNGRIWLYKYHCRSVDKDYGTMIEGSTSLRSGDHWHKFFITYWNILNESTITTIIPVPLSFCHFSSSPTLSPIRLLFLYYLWYTLIHFIPLSSILPVWPLLLYFTYKLSKKMLMLWGCKRKTHTSVILILITPGIYTVFTGEIVFYDMKQGLLVLIREMKQSSDSLSSFLSTWFSSHRSKKWILLTWLL